MEPPVKDLRNYASYALEGVPDEAVVKLLEHLPDVDLATTACLMTNRPKWVEEIIGPWPKSKVH